MVGRCKGDQRRAETISTADLDRVWASVEDPYYYTTKVHHLSTLHSHPDCSDFSIVSTIYNTGGRVIPHLTSCCDDD